MTEMEYVKIESGREIKLNGIPSDFYTNKVVFRVKPGGVGALGKSEIMSVEKTMKIKTLKKYIAERAARRDQDVQDLIHRGAVSEELLLIYVNPDTGERLGLDNEDLVKDVIFTGELIEVAMLDK